MRGLVFFTIGILIGSIVGFILANNIFKAGINGQISESQNQALSASNSETKTATSVNSETSPNQLSKQEIQLAISQADKKPEDLKLQENLGIALYQYSVLERDPQFLNEIIRLLERARSKQVNPQPDLLMTLGNVYLDLVRSRFDKQKNLLARSAFEQVLKQNSYQKEALLNIGLTHFYDQPQNPETSFEYYQKAYKIDNSDQNVLENLILAALKLDRQAEFSQAVEQLKLINPNHPVLSNLDILAAQQNLK